MSTRVVRLLNFEGSILNHTSLRYTGDMKECYWVIVPTNAQRWEDVPKSSAEKMHHECGQLAELWPCSAWYHSQKRIAGQDCFQCGPRSRLCENIPLR